MKLFNQALLAGGLVFVLFACSSKDNSEPPALLSEITDPIELEVVWSTDTDAIASSASFDMRPMMVGNLIYSVDIEGRVQCINAESGRVNWRYDTEIAAITGLSGNQDVIAVTSGNGDLAVFDLIDEGLQPRWSIQLKGEIRAAPAISQNQIFVRTVAGKLSAISLVDGSAQWTISRRIPALTLTGNSSPLLTGEFVITGFDDGKIAAFERENGQIAWETVVSHPAGRTEIERLVDIDGQFILQDGIIYVSTYQGKLAAIQAINGNVLWSRKFSSYQAIVADDDALYLSGDLSHLWSIDRRSGSAFWKQDLLHARKITAPQLINGNIVVADLEGYVHWFDKSDGRLMGRIQPSTTGHISQPLRWQKHVLVFDREGQLFSLTRR